MEMNMKQFFYFIDVPTNNIDEPWEDNNTLTIEELEAFRTKKSRIAKKKDGSEYTIYYKSSSKLVSAYLKYSDNIFCLDIDDTRFENQDIHKNIENVFGVLPPYSFSRTKQKPHYYFRVIGVPEYSNEVDIFIPFIGDLISRKKNMWELSNQLIQNFSGELPTFEWSDIKQHFNVDKMNNIKQENKPEVKPEIKQEIKQEIEQSTNQTKYDRMVLHLDPKKRAFNYDNWFKLLMLCKNLGVLYSTFVTISKNSGYSGFNEADCKNKWDSYICNTDRKIGYKTLRDWLREDNPEEFERIEVGDAVNSLLKDATNENGAKIFSAYNSGEIYYSNECGFIVFKNDCNLWKLNVDDNIIKNDISTFFKKRILLRTSQLAKKAISDEESDIGDTIKQLGNLIKIVGNDSWLKGCLNLLKGKIMEESQEIIKKLQTAPNVISFSNGICYDFSMKSSRNLTKDDYQTQTTGYPWIECDEKNIETVLSLFKSFHENDEMTRTLLSSMACSLYGANINEKFFVWTGSGRNGKSTVESLFMSVLGNYYASINASQLTSYAKEADRANTELAKLRFSRAVITGEPESSDVKNDTLKISVIKRWTGRDPITTRTLHKESFTFVPQFTPYLLCNNIPMLSDVDGGISERLRVIPFNLRFTGENGKKLEENQRIGDINLKEKIRTNEYKYGLLHLLIQTWNETNGKFYECDEVIKATKVYFEDQNVVKHWFFENYKIDEKGRISATQLYNHFKKCGNDYNQKKFISDLKKLVECIRSDGAKYKCSPIISENFNDCMIEKDL